MTKLYFPSGGIYRSSKSDIDNCLNDLSRAISNATFDIPAGFSYSGDLRSLSSTLNNYYQELKSIDYRLQNTNNNFNILEDDLEMSAKKMEAVKIKERDRMII